MNVLSSVATRPARKLRVTRRQLSKQVKIILAQFKERYSWQARNGMKAALKSLLDLNELDPPLIGLKISGQRPVKPYISWTDAERIISRTAVEYQPAFRFMLWSALDTARFVNLNCDSERIQAMKAQLRDQTKDWIKVWIPEGRKNCPPFGVFVPREIADFLPVLHQDGSPIRSKQSLHYQWRNARERAGFKINRFGQHNLRSVWKSEATRRKLDPLVRQYQLGHLVDPQNYERLQQDDDWVTGEFRTAWATKPLATQEELMQRDKAIDEVQKKLQEVEAIATSGSKAEIIKAVKEAREEIVGKWLSQTQTSSDDEWRAFSTPMQMARVFGARPTTPPPELKQLDKILRVLENRKSTALQVYKAQKRFEQIIGTSRQ